MGVRAKLDAMPPTAPVADRTGLAARADGMQGLGRSRLAARCNAGFAPLPRARRRLIIPLTGWMTGNCLIARVLRGLAAVVVLALAGPAAAQTSVDDSERGIVRVVVILETPEGRSLYGSGSGFVVAPNLVVTAAHVVQPARQRAEFGLAIVPPEGDGLVPARIIRFSPSQEFALLEFRGPDLPALTISTVEPKAGDGVVALGYPDVDYQGATGADLLRPTPASRTSGQISSLRDRAPTRDPIPTINHQAVISSGSSGGPLLDECGRVIGVNTWHVSGADTRETRGVSTRAASLLQFLDEAGVTPTLSDDRCLSFAERVEADRSATIQALQTQNQSLAAKLEAADRLTRIALVILIGGTLALFVAVCVLGAIVLSRRRGQNGEQHAHDAASHHHATAPDHAHQTPPDTHHQEHTRRRRVGVIAIVGGAAAAVALVVGASVLLLNGRNQNNAQPQASSAFSGAIACTLDRERSVGSQGVSDMSFTASGELCVNERTLYARVGESKQFRRAIVLGEARALDVLTIDTATGEFRRERYPLDDEAFAAANEAVAASGAGRGCDGDPSAVAHRNEAITPFAQGEPSQRLIWRCEARN
jgi:S1-C subfamily serine protease